MLKRKNSESDEANVKRAAVEIRHDEEGTDSQPDSSSEIPQNNENDPSSKPNIVSSHKLNVDFDPSTYIHLRLLVTLREAAVIIGKGGSTIAKIRGDSGIKLNVSDHVEGIIERVVNLKGSAEHVSKAAGLIVRHLNNEQLDSPSAPTSKRFILRVLIPHKMMGAMIGKGGSRFREIEEASAAKLKAREEIMPNSTDRVLQIDGVADAIHIAVYYVCTTYITHKEYLGNQRPTFYNPASVLHQNQFYPMMHQQRGYGPYPQAPGPYGPGPRGSPGYFNPPPMQLQPYNSGSMRYPQRMGPGMGQNMNVGMGGMGRPPQNANITNPNLRSAQTFAQQAERGKQLKQDVQIPNDFVGSVIGKGGYKISQLRQQSGSNIKVNDPVPNSSERVVSIVGPPECNEYAIVLINNVIENEKRKNRNNQNNRNNSGSENSHKEYSDNPATDNGSIGHDSANEIKTE